MIYTGGTNVDIARPEATWFSVIGKGYALGLPIPILIVCFVSAIAYFLLHGSVFGRYVFATGGNESAAYYSGVDSRKVIAGCYVLSSFSVAISAVILSSRVSGAQNDMGAGYELTVLAAIIIGGASLLGGSGAVIRTLGGVMLLGFVTNGLIFLGLPFYAQWLVTWAVLLLSVWADVATRRGTVFT
jgi:ribose transport system permease protein